MSAKGSRWQGEGDTLGGAMIALKTVLVPTDFSTTSDSALRYGKALAQAFGATLHVVHVIEEPYGQPWAVEAYGFSLAALQEEWVKDAGTRLAGSLTDEERTALKAVTTTVLGHPVMEILRYANDNAVDLIVIGTHGRGPLGHVVLGSVAERVVRKAPCPVLTVRTPEREFVE
jgi:nucleotide-binding universal stress UspA family protein